MLALELFLHRCGVHVQDVIKIVVGNHKNTHCGNYHKLLFSKGLLHQAHQVLRHMLGVTGNGAAIFDQQALIIGKIRDGKVNMVLFQQAGKIGAAYQAVILQRNGVLIKICGALADQPLQLTVQLIGAFFQRMERRYIMQQGQLFVGQLVALGQVVIRRGADLLRGCGKVNL